MSSDYIPRLRRELVAAAASEQPVLRPRRLVRPFALVAVAVAAVILALIVLPPVAERPIPAGGDRLEYHLTGGDPGSLADCLRHRVALAGLHGVNVSVAGEQVRLSAPQPLSGAIDALIAPGVFAVYDWERSVVGPDGRPVPTDPTVTGGDDAGSAAAALPIYSAVLRASGQPTRGSGSGSYWLVDDAHQRVLAGPASSAADFTGPGRAVRVPGGTTVVRAEGSTDRAYVLAGTPALTETDVAGAGADRDQAIPEPIVREQFTPDGVAAFTRLTRDVAHRGSSLKTNQHLALVLDDRLLSTPYIDYRQAPDGIDGSAGSQISGGLTAQRAAILAAILSTGSLPTNAG
jgi:SecD/SecF fusion protein